MRVIVSYFLSLGCPCKKWGSSCRSNRKAWTAIKILSEDLELRHNMFLSVFPLELLILTGNKGKSSIRGTKSNKNMTLASKKFGSPIKKSIHLLLVFCEGFSINKYNYFGYNWAGLETQSGFTVACDSIGEIFTCCKSHWQVICCTRTYLSLAPMKV